MLLIALLMAIFLSGEWYLHCYKPSLVEFDPELGWKLKANFDRTYEQKTLQGQKYQARFQTNEYGFRTYGNNDPNSLKILVLGDSFTADAFSSNEQAWFSVLAQEIEREKKLLPNSVTVWAGGAGGYGTLQELILAKRIKQHFKPDLLIVQFCTNDYIDNSQDLENSTFLRQLKFRRPYLNSEEKIQFNQGVLAFLYRSFIFENSRILNKLDSLINGLEYKIYSGYSWPVVNLEQQRKKSYEITKILLEKFHKEFEDIPNVIIICSSDPNNIDKQWLNLVRGVGFVPIIDPSDEIYHELKTGKDLLHSDGGHWNINGNKLVGKILYKQMKQLGYLN